MKGKSKGRAKDREFWPMDSDDELPLGRSAPAKSGLMGGSWDDGMGGSSYMQMARKDVVKARNSNQERYMRLLEAESPSVVVATGPAGTGKTMMAVHVGVRKLQSGKVAKLIITRPAVCTDEEIGFLPGDLESKMHPYVLPVLDVIHQYYSPNDVTKMMAKGVIEICPFAFMRGRTFEHAWIVADECQNCTKSQVMMLLTRIGNGSKMVLTGDPAQHDRGFEKNGLQDFMQRLDLGKKRTKQRESAYYESLAAETEIATGEPFPPPPEDPEEVSFHDIQMVRFHEGDVERHPVIKKILRLYADDPK